MVTLYANASALHEDLLQTKMHAGLERFDLRVHGCTLGLWPHGIQHTDEGEQRDGGTQGLDA